MAFEELLELLAYSCAPPPPPNFNVGVVFIFLVLVFGGVLFNIEIGGVGVFLASADL